VLASDRANSPLGRTALMIQGLALAFGIITWLIVAFGFFDKPEQVQEYVGVVSVGCMASLVFATWSVWLAVNGVIKGEGMRAPFLVLLSFLILVSAISSSLWIPILQGEQPGNDLQRYAIAWGFPLFVPFLAAVTFVGGLFGSVLSNWREKRGKAHAAAPWTRGRWLKVWITSSSCVLALLTAALLPFPLYLYCVVTNPNAYPDPPYQRLPDWRNATIHLMPDYVKVVVHKCLCGHASSRIQEWLKKAIEHGELPASVIATNLLDQDGYCCKLAWDRASLLRSSGTLALALSIGYGKVPAPACAHRLAGEYVGGNGPISKIEAYLGAPELQGTDFLTGVLEGLSHLQPNEAVVLGLSLGNGERTAPMEAQKLAGRSVGMYGPQEKIREYLARAQFEESPFLKEVIVGLGYGRGREFEEELIALTSGSAPLRQVAMSAAASILSAEKRGALWREFAKDPDPTRRSQAARALIENVEGESLAGFLRQYLADESLLVRRVAAAGAWRCYRLPRTLTREDLRLVASLAELIGDPDLAIRRGAAFSLMRIVPSGLWNKNGAITPAMADVIAGRPAPETPEETKARDQIRSGAQEWLKKQESKGLVGNDK